MTTTPITDEQHLQLMGITMKAMIGEDVPVAPGSIWGTMAPIASEIVTLLVAEIASTIEANTALECAAAAEGTAGSAGAAIRQRFSLPARSYNLALVA
jgi:hypothetical protein